MVKLLLTDSYYKVFETLNDCIKDTVNDLDGKNLVFCEEKISLMAERCICARFGGSFNTEVYSFGNFLRVKKSLDNVLSKEGSAMVVKKLLGEVTLNCFRSSKVSLAPSLFDLIIQLKSAGVTPQDLENAKNGVDGVLKNKLVDVQSVFSAYENYLTENGVEDQSSMLAYLPEVLEKQDLSQTDVYLLGFSSLTKQAKNGISVLLKKAKSVTAILVEGDNQFAYLNETDNVFRTACQQLNIKFTEQRVDGVWTDEAKVIADNIFNPLSKVKRVNTQKIFCSPAKTLYEEVERIAITIKREVMDGKIRYKDVGVALADGSEYKEYVKSCFGLLDIPYFFDEKKKVSNHPLVHLIIDYIDVFRKGFSRKTLCSLCTNPLMERDKDFTDKFVKYVKKCNAFYSSFERQFEFAQGDQESMLAYEEYRAKIVGLFAKFNVKNFLKALDVERKLQEFTDALSTEMQFEESAINGQIYQAIDKILTEMQSLLGDSSLSFNEFRNVFLSGVEALELSIIPQYNDAVFVGGFKEASLGRFKYLFAPGLTIDVPSVKDDVALLSDGDIDALAQIKIMVEPKIKVVNHRVKESVALGVSAFIEHLYASYPLTSRDGSKNVKGEVYNFINDAFTVRPFVSSDFYLTEKQAKISFAKACSDYYEGITTDFKDANAYYFLNEDRKELQRLSVESSLEPKVTLEKNTRVMLDGVTSPTTIEDYYKCPYKSFVAHGLRVRDDDEGQVDGLSYGNLMHAIFEKYLAKVDQVTDVESSNALFEKVSAKVLEDVQFKRFTQNDADASAIERALDECKRFCYKTYRSLAVSKFSTSRENLERTFGRKDDGIQLLDGKVKLAGKIDRVDEFGDYCRIIDYKTGGADDECKKLFAGLKLQLYLYGLAVKDKKIAGLYYLPVKDTFQAEDKKSTSLVVGKTLDDPNVLHAQDQTLQNSEKSEILPLTLTKDGKWKGLTSAENMDAMVEYAFKMSENAAKQMDDGVIVASPFEKTCEYCSYKALCGREREEGRKVRTVHEQDIYESVKGDNPCQN